MARQDGMLRPVLIFLHLVSADGYNPLSLLYALQRSTPIIDDGSCGDLPSSMGITSTSNRRPSRGDVTLPAGQKVS